MNMEQTKFSRWPEALIILQSIIYGFGDPIYKNVGYAWFGHFDGKAPDVPLKNNHKGMYRRTIAIPDAWQGKQVIAHFGSVTSCVLIGHVIEAAKRAQ